MKKFVVFILSVMLICMASAAALAAGTAVKSVKLNKTSITLTAGGTFQLKATVSPGNAKNKTVTYSTSDKKVATVTKKGQIKAVAAGTCTITAKSNNGKTAKVTVKVIPKVTKVKLNKSTVTMLGKTVKLTATCEPKGSSQKVTWSSDNKKIATVSSDGVVTPKGYGSCKITAKSGNGKTATCTIKVEKNNKFTKSYTTESWPYMMKDTFTVTVDGLTGKITSNDCYQSKRDVTLLGQIKMDGIKAYHVEKTYVEFRSTYSMKVGLKAAGIEIGTEMVTGTFYYKMDNQGNLTVTDSRCSDLLGLCKLLGKY